MRQCILVSFLFYLVQTNSFAQQTEKVILYFNYGKSELTDSSKLTEENSLVKIEKIAHVELGGHTDNDGSEVYNVRLSRNRVTVVQDHLISKGIGIEKINVTCYGKSRPIASNNTPEGKQKNRRVEIDITYRAMGDSNYKEIAESINTNTVMAETTPCDPSLYQLTTQEVLYFNYGQHEITEDSKAKVSDLLARLNHKNIVEVKLTGHTDGDGSVRYNLILSQERVAIVQRYLNSKGINTSKFNSAYFGKGHPIASNDTEAGKQINRRVEMMVKFDDCMKVKDTNAEGTKTKTRRIDTSSEGDKKNKLLTPTPSYAVAQATTGVNHGETPNSKSENSIDNFKASASPQKKTPPSIYITQGDSQAKGTTQQPLRDEIAISDRTTFSLQKNSVDSVSNDDQHLAVQNIQTKPVENPEEDIRSNQMPLPSNKSDSARNSNTDMATNKVYRTDAITNLNENPVSVIPVNVNQQDQKDNKEPSPSGLSNKSIGNDSTNNRTTTEINVLQVTNDEIKPTENLHPTITTSAQLNPDQNDNKENVTTAAPIKLVARDSVKDNRALKDEHAIGAVTTAINPIGNTMPATDSTEIPGYKTEAAQVVNSQPEVAVKPSVVNTGTTNKTDSLVNKITTAKDVSDMRAGSFISDHALKIHYDSTEIQHESTTVPVTVMQTSNEDDPGNLTHVDSIQHNTIHNENNVVYNNTPTTITTQPETPPNFAEVVEEKMAHLEVAIQYGAADSINRSNAVADRNVSPSTDTAGQHDNIQTFVIPANADASIKGQQGTTVTFAKNSFVTSNGEPIHDSVTVQLQEVYTKSDMLNKNLATASNGELLESGGMVNLQVASQNSQAVFLEKNSSFKVEFPTEAKQKDMTLFYSKGSSDGQDWVPADRAPEKDSASLENQKAMDKYVFRSSKLGWLNCDRFTGMNNKTNLRINLEDADETNVCLVFKRINSVLNISKKNKDLVFSRIPIGEEATLIAFSKKADQIFFASKSLIIEKNKVEMLTLQKLTETEFQQRIRQFN